MQNEIDAEALATPRPAPCPVAAPDGRRYTLDFLSGDEWPDVYTPDPPCDGDAVYCLGVQVGTFHGDASKPGGWYVDLNRSRDLPPELAKAIASPTPSRAVG